MASDDDCEDGEILEEAKIPKVPSSPLRSQFNNAFSSAAVPTAIQGCVQPPIPLGPHLSMPCYRNPRKRPHSSLKDDNLTNLTSVYDTRTPLSHGQSIHYNTNSSSGHTERRRDVASIEHQDDRVYAEDLIIKYPRQQPCSNVLLNFATWMGTSRSRKRLDVEDVQKLVLNVLRGNSTSEGGLVSPYLLPDLTPGAQLPAKVCILLLKKMHPSVLQKYRAKLRFFDECSSVPLVLTKHELPQIRRSETSLPELLYKFPRPTVDTHELATDELFYAHELTFLMKHSAGFTDELVLIPTGTFTRQSQPLGGTWVLDGDLLHLKWRQRTSKRALDEMLTDPDNAIEEEEEEDDAYTLDVLVSQDGSMHEFRTETVTDEAYAREVPEHLSKRSRDDKPRSIWLSLAKAVAVDVPRSADGAPILQMKKAKGMSTQMEMARANGKDAKEVEPLCREAFEYYMLSLEELKQHGFPTDVEEEQRRLVKTTEGGTRDNYVATKPRPNLVGNGASVINQDKLMETEKPLADDTLSKEFIYALDCEMCETDLGMELTRVTVVDIKGAVVYDQLVKPQSTILNYHTEFSGISEETLRETKCILTDVQRDLVTQFLFEDTILVGHSLTSDLRALRLVHLTIGDTAIVYPHQRGFPFRTSLKYLTKTYLNRDIQLQNQNGHDSTEDAIASLELFLLKVRKGPWFGIPDAGFSSEAFDSIADKVFALDKTMAMIRLRSQTARKPWDLYASGDQKIESWSPFCHAHAVKAKAEACSSTTAAKAMVKLESCASWETLKSSLKDVMGAQPSEQPDFCWVEIEPFKACTTLYDDFVKNHEHWMAEQLTYCEQVDTFLQQIRDEVLTKNTLLLALPQGDLSLLRYLKGLRTRSKWRDANQSDDSLAPEELHAAVGDAFRGAMDSCLFLMQKL